MIFPQWGGGGRESLFQWCFLQLKKCYTSWFLFGQKILFIHLYDLFLKEKNSKNKTQKSAIALEEGKDPTGYGTSSVLYKDFSYLSNIWNISM